MIIHSKVLKETKRSTLSEVYIDGEFFCYNLEDGFNKEKIYGETRIPHGIYEIETRKEGKHYYKYNNKWGHKWAFWIRHISNFQFVMWHIGNFIEDTLGCPLCGDGYSIDTDGDYRTLYSTNAYKKLYKVLTPVFEKGEEKVLICMDRSESMFEDQEPIDIKKIIDK